jgi:hypothetical protein
VSLYREKDFRERCEFILDILNLSMERGPEEMSVCRSKRERLEKKV